MFYSVLSTVIFVLILNCASEVKAQGNGNAYANNKLNQEQININKNQKFPENNKHREPIYNSEGNLVAINFYDNNGVLLRTNHYGAKSKLTGYSLYNYDETGELINTDTYNTSGILTQKTFYGENKQLLYSLNYNEQGKIIGITNYGDSHYEPVYNDNGDLVCMNSYDNNGFLQRSNYHGENGEIIGYSIYNYNEAGELVSVDTYNSNDVLTQRTFYAANKQKLYTLNYDEQGKVIGTTNYADSQMQQTTQEAILFNVTPIMINSDLPSEHTAAYDRQREELNTTQWNDR